MDGSAENRTLRWLIPTAIVLFLFAVVYFCYPLLGGGSPAPEVLESQALDAAVAPEIRVESALQLSDLGAKAQPQMRRVLAESKDSDVRAAAVQGLMHIGDWQDVPQLIKALDDPSPWVRTRAARAVWRHLGTHYDFDPSAEPGTQVAAIAKIQRQYQWQDDYRRFHHESPDAQKPH